MKAICNCGKEFEVTEDMIKEEYLGAMYDEVYFKCPCCNKKYIVGIRNIKCRTIIRQMSNLRKINPGKFDKWSLRISELQKELKCEMDKINGKKVR